MEQLKRGGVVPGAVLEFGTRNGSMVAVDGDTVTDLRATSPTASTSARPDRVVQAPMAGRVDVDTPAASVPWWG